MSDHEPMRPKGRSHPSGRPIRPTHIVGRSIWRIPDDGPVTPRLQKRHDTYAVGFTATFPTEDDD